MLCQKKQLIKQNVKLSNQVNNSQIGNNSKTSKKQSGKVVAQQTYTLVETN